MENTLRAIVLSCDKYRALAEHMIFEYDRLWPGHPFRFRIPYQELGGEPAANREYCESPKPIKDTVLKLIDDLEDEEWIYWCVDDKYPIGFDLPKVEALASFVREGPPADISGILFCRCREMLSAEHLAGGRYETPDRQVLLRRRNYHQIWIHQFLRVKVIRGLFRQFPEEIPYAKLMDDLKDKLLPPDTHCLYVTEKNLAVFGESTVSGRLTLNCLKSMAAHEMAPPESMPQMIIEVTMGELPGAASSSFQETDSSTLKRQLAASSAEAKAGRRRTEELQQKAAGLKIKLNAMREERDALRGSAEYRIGRKLVNPLRKLARALTGKRGKGTKPGE